MTALTTEKRGNHWWITGMPDGEPDCGPYATRKEAESDLRGLRRFDRMERRGRLWMTVDTKPEREKR